jgi:hypothetical protein
VTIVIVLGLVVLWAVVLVPMWLRRHDEVEEARSLDRFSSAMHSLSLKEREAQDKKYVVMPHRSRARDVHVSGGPVSEPVAPPPRRSAAASSRASVDAAARRRTTLNVLLLSVGFTLAGAYLVGGTLIWGLQLVADACLIVFVVYLRTQARSGAVSSGRLRTHPAARRERYVELESDEYEDDYYEQPVARSRVRSQPPPVATAQLFDQSSLDEVDADDAWNAEPSYAEPRYAEAVFDRASETEPRVVQREFVREPVREPAPQAPARRQASRRETAARRDDVYDPSAPRDRTVEYERSAPSERVAAYARDLEVDQPSARPARRRSEPEPGIGARPWEPVPVPRPTYTTKPTAPRRTPRAPMPEPQAPAAQKPAAKSPAEELEEILDRRWAVND